MATSTSSRSSSASTGAATPSASTSPGGTVQPASKVAEVIKPRLVPVLEPNERYELRDPFAEATYHAKTWPEMVAKAEQLGSTRFVAVGADGQRTPVVKQDGEWQRQPVRLQVATPQAPAQTQQTGGPEATRPAFTASPPPRHIAEVLKREIRAEHEALLAQLKAALAERYVIKQAPIHVGNLKIGHTEYRFRGDTSRLAFTESTFKLVTDINSPSVARSMVDVAQARQWKGLRVSGHEDFRRMVWLEATVRGVKAIGYEPTADDLVALSKEREARQVNRVEPLREPVPSGITASAGAQAPAPAAKDSARGGGGRKAVLAAIEAVLVAKGLPANKREAVMAAAADQLAQRQRDGQVTAVKVYDKDATSNRPAPTPNLQPQRPRERAAPAR